jgi:PAS domain S-box-containing protein
MANDSYLNLLGYIIEYHPVDPLYHILYVDDEPALLEVGKIYLEPGGEYSVDISLSAPAALTMMASKQYDAIISDYQMPKMDGIELLKRLRTSGNKIPFILFTGRGREEIIIQALNEGADFYLQKGGEPKSQFAELKHKIRIAIESRQSDHALVESEQKYRTIFENAVIGIFQISPDGRLISANPAFARMYGCESPEELLLEMPDIAGDPHATAKDRTDVLRILHEQGVINSREIPVRRKDGTQFWISLTARSIVDTNGKVLRYEGTIIDITARKEAEEKLLESESRFSAFMDNLPVTAFIKDEHSTNLYVNKAMDDTFSARKWIGKSVLDIFPADAADKMIADDLKVLTEGHLKTIETLQVKGGDIRIFETYKFRIDREHNPPLIGGFAVDVTERKRAGEKIRESEKKFSTVFQSNPVSLTLVSATDGTFVEVNDAFLRNTGYTRKEMIGKTSEDLGIFADMDDYAAMVTELQNQRHVSGMELRCRMKNGEILYCQFSSGIILMDGRPYILSSVENITQRKQAEEKLRENEKIFRSMLNATPAGVLLLVNRVFQRVNPALEKITGYSSEEMVGQSTRLLYPDDDEYLRVGRELYGQINRDGSSVLEARMRRKDGAIIKVLLSLSPFDPLNASAGVTGTVLDITGRTRATKALEESEAAFRDFFNNTSDAIVIHNLQGRFLEVNDEICRRLGYTREEMLNMSPADIDDPAYAVHVPQRISELQQTGRTVFETAHRRKDGTRIPTEVSGRVITFHGEPAILVTGRDITGRKQAENALRESEERFRAIFAIQQNGILIIDPSDHTIVDVNQYLSNLIGLPKDQILGKVCHTFVCPAEKGSCPITDLGQCVDNTERVLITADGRKVPVLKTVTRITLEGKDYLIENVQDIIGLKTAENALRQTNRKLNLLSGITRHDIKNQLTALEAYLDISKNTLADPVKTVEFIEKEKSIAKTITRQISFTRDYEDLGVESPLWQNIADRVRSAMTGLPIRNIKIDIDRADLEVLADPLLEKVFYNLVDNALRYGGEGTTAIRISSEESGQGIVISVQDDGMGITAEDKTRLFERGFGKNTGLGLFLSREILGITGITITETGAPGKGARFEIVVPKGAYRFTL